MDPTISGDDVWECGFASARRRKFLLGLRATPIERLRWLEDSLRVALASGALQSRRAADRKRDGLWDDQRD